jgi:hypothetical protein
MSEDDDVMASKVEVLVPVGTLHLDGPLAQQPALELSACDHVPSPAPRIQGARVDDPSQVCYYRLTEDTAMGARRWGPALLIGIIVVAAADEEYVIWRSSALNGFDWVPGSGAYSSKEACDQAVAARQARISKAVAFLRRIGADDTLLRVVGDRVYECRPAIDSPPSRRSRSEPAQSP